MKCPLCSIDLEESKVFYCPGCRSMYRGNENLHFDGEYWYGFVDEGEFALIGKAIGDEPRWKLAKERLKKALFHLLSATLWFSLFLLFPKLAYCFALLGFAHLFFMGCHFTQALLTRGISDFYFPPHWERLRRRLRKINDRSLLVRNGLDAHPGFLLNLSIAAYRAHNDSLSSQALNEALSLCPHHPHLQNISNQIKVNGLGH